MKFRYYITDTFSGTIRGTNDSAVARELAECEDYFVVDADSGEWLVPDSAREEVKEW